MFKRMIALLMVIAAIAIVGAGCSSNSPTEPMNDASNEAQLLSSTGLDNSSADVADMSADRRFHRGSYDPMTFLVRFENVSTGMTLMLSNGETAPAPHSPGVWAISRFRNPLFKIGHFDSGMGLEQQAEDGDPSILYGNIADNFGVSSSGVFNTPVGDDSPGPALPGKAYEFTVTASPGDRLFLTSMFGQSNDLFYAPGAGIPLFTWRGTPMDGDVTHFFKLWDAGTEVNQEPGLGPDQAPRQSGPNTGESEHKRILPVHDEYTYPATKDVIKVTITPMDAVS